MLETAQLKPECWWRYVDDTCVVWQHGRDALDRFHQHLNAYTCPSIKFTWEVGQGVRLPFLDVEVVRAGDGLKAVVCRKGTSSNMHLHYVSHPADCIKNGCHQMPNKAGEVVCS